MTDTQALAAHQARTNARRRDLATWGPRATNTVLCDTEGTILARGVGDRTALSVIRAHYGPTGHAILRQRTRYQAWPPADLP